MAIILEFKPNFHVSAQEAPVNPTNTHSTNITTIPSKAADLDSFGKLTANPTTTNSPASAAISAATIIEQLRKMNTVADPANGLPLTPNLSIPYYSKGEYKRWVVAIGETHKFDVRLHPAEERELLKKLSNSLHLNIALVAENLQKSLGYKVPIILEGKGAPDPNKFPFEKNLPLIDLISKEDNSASAALVMRRSGKSFSNSEQESTMKDTIVLHAIHRLTMANGNPIEPQANARLMDIIRNSTNPDGSINQETLAAWQKRLDKAIEAHPKEFSNIKISFTQGQTKLDLNVPVIISEKGHNHIAKQVIENGDKREEETRNVVSKVTEEGKYSILIRGLAHLDPSDESYAGLREILEKSGIGVIVVDPVGQLIKK